MDASRRSQRADIRLVHHQDAPADLFTRTPPHSLEAEESVCGGLMVDSAWWSQVSQVVRSTDFYVQRLRNLYVLIGELVAEGRPIDTVTVTEGIQSRGMELTPTFVVELTERVPTAVNILHYAEIVRKYAVQREVVDAAYTLATTALDRVPDLDAFLDASGRIMREALSRRATPTSTSAAASVATFGRFLDQPQSVLVPTGLGFVDHDLGGIGRRRLLTIAGRPGKGKTTLALRLIVAWCLHGVGVLIHSLEMAKAELVGKLCAFLTGIENVLIQNGTLSAPQREDVFEAMELITKWPLWIRAEEHDDASWESHLAAYHAECDAHPEIQVVIMENLQLVEGDHRRRGNGLRYLDVGDTTKSLKGFARKRDKAVLALSQVKRPDMMRLKKGENPESIPPRMSDLKESGRIEEDSDGIWMLHRPPEVPDALTIYKRKDRHGPSDDDCRVQCYYDPRYGRIEDWAARYAYLEREELP